MSELSNQQEQRVFKNINYPFSNYAISKEGHIKNLRNGKISIPSYIGASGYHQTSLGTDEGKPKTINIHAIIAQVWVHNPDPLRKKDAIFIDGNRTNINADNLKWASRSELIEHNKRLGKYSQLKPVIVTNLETGKQTKFASVRSVTTLLGIHSALVDGCLSGKYPSTQGFKIEYLDPNTVRNVNSDFTDLSKFSRYFITADGKVYSYRTGKEIKSYIDTVSGYIRTTLVDDDNKRKSLSVHRLVASKYVENPDPINKKFINHIDHDKTNNDDTNLEWVTLQENNYHSKQKKHNV